MPPGELKKVDMEQRAKGAVAKKQKSRREGKERLGERKIATGES